MGVIIETDRLVAAGADVLKHLLALMANLIAGTKLRASGNKTALAQGVIVNQILIDTLHVAELVSAGDIQNVRLQIPDLLKTGF